MTRDKHRGRDVYILENGEDYEDSSILGVYSSLPKAMEALKKEHPNLEFESKTFENDCETLEWKIGSWAYASITKFLVE